MPKNAVQKKLYPSASVSYVSGAAGTSSSGGNADTVDGFHASATATANYLYPLGAGARYPAAVLPSTVAYYDAAQAWTAVQTFTTGLLLAADIGPAAAQKHTLPAVTSDTIALLAAAQTLAAKTLTLPVIADFTNATHGHTGTSGGGQLNASSVFSAGAVPLARGGINADLSATGAATHFLRQASAGATITVGALGLTDLPSGIGGDGLTEASGVLAVGAGTGISVSANATAVDTAYAFVWSALHTFNAGATIAAGQSLGFGSDVALSRKSADVLQLSAGDNLQTPTFTSGYVGWNLDADGNAEFNNVVMRGEMRASVFSVGEIHATGGSLLVLPAYLVFEDVTSV